MNNTVTREQVMEVLKQVSYPGYSRDIVSFGLVKDVQASTDQIFVQLVLKSADANMGDEIRQNVESRLKQNFKISHIKVEMNLESPEKKSSAQDSRMLNNIKYKVAVASGKGGVGKSTVAVNLAIAFAQMGWKTGLLDADIYGPSIPLMLDIKEKPFFDGNKLHPIEKHGVHWMSIGFLVDQEDAVVWRGALVHRALQQLMTDVIWPDLDIILFDMPPGTGDAQLTLSQSVSLDGATIVSTPQDVALVDAVKGVQMFRKVNVPIMGIIENMSYFLCPHCGEKTDIFSSGGAVKAAENLQVDVLGQIPIDAAIREGGDGGKPVVTSNSSTVEVFSAITKKISKKLK